jgi:hypothetical protein
MENDRCALSAGKKQQELMDMLSIENILVLISLGRVGGSMCQEATFQPLAPKVHHHSVQKCLV